MRFVLGFVGAMLLAACASDAPVAQDSGRVLTGFSAERLARLDAVLEESIEDGQIAGAVVLLEDDGMVVHRAAFGMADREAGREMQPDTLFRIASMTKPVTSVAVMMLYEEGHFLLDDPVGAYLPEFDREMSVINFTDDGYELVPADNAITIRHLLTHTSGLAYRFMAPEPLPALYAAAGVYDGLGGEDMSLAEFSRRLAGVPLLHEPGQGWTYGLNTDVLGRLVEVVSGQPFEDFLRSRLFEPLGMQDTYFLVPSAKRDRLARVYRRDDSGSLEPIPGGRIEAGNLEYSVDFPVREELEYRSGGGGLVSTAGDYARFLRMLANGGELDGRRILGPKTIELMFSDQAGRYGQQSFAGRGFGLGFAIGGGPGTSGQPGAPGIVSWSGLFNTFFWIDPAENLFAILMTQQQPYDMRLEPLFRALVYQALIE
jgi:CubicO group peptidase (beta-lactamase class C family)